MADINMIYRFCYDYFFHYLLIRSDLVRLFLCRYIAEDCTIMSTEIKGTESYQHYYDGKKMIMDLTVIDDKGRLYNFEMQNYIMSRNEQIRMQTYCQDLVNRQLKKGKDYHEIKDVFQLIFYTGEPIDGFMNYRHILRKGDLKYMIAYQGDKIKTELLQLQLLKEEKDMDMPLTTIDQMGYLFMFDKLHPNSQPDEVIEEIMKLHEQYMKSDEWVKALEMEREIYIYTTKINESKREGKAEGKKEELFQNVQLLIKSLYQKDASEWLINCNEEQMKRAFVLVSTHPTYEELKRKILE